MFPVFWHRDEDGDIMVDIPCFVCLMHEFTLGQFQREQKERFEFLREVYFNEDYSLDPVDEDTF
jgi:hypothetical protein